MKKNCELECIWIEVSEASSEMIWMELEIETENVNNYYVFPLDLTNYAEKFIWFLIIITISTLIGFGIIMKYYDKIYPRHFTLSVSKT